MSPPETDRRPVRVRRRAVIAGAVLGALVGLVWAGSRPATFEAESRIVVGSFDADANDVAGYVLATEILARNYDRIADSGVVLGPVASQLDLRIVDLRDSVSVAAVPQSSVLRVRATAGDARDAGLVAELVARQLTASIGEMTAGDDSDQLLAAHRTASEELADAVIARDALRFRLGALVADDATTATVQTASEALQTAEVEVRDADLRVQALAEQFLDAQRDVSSASDVRVLGDAVVDEQSVLLAVVVAVLLGAAIGAGLPAAALGWRGAAAALRHRSAGSAVPAVPGGATS